jgi:excisionase family DNA binding protein
MSALDLHALAEELAPLIAEQARPPALLDADQAGELLNVPSSWVSAQARANRIPHTRLGHYVRFDRDELLAWVDHRQTGPRVSR